MNNIAQPWRRFLAHLVDFGISILVPIYLIYIFSTLTDITNILNHISFYLVFLIFSYSIIYTLLASFLTSTFGGTIGKLLTGIKVVRGDGQNLSFRRALFRNYIGYMVSGLLFGLGFLWMIFDKERRAWHDQIADTFVIVRNKWLVISGMAFFAIIVFVELVLINLSIVNFKSNSTIYTTIVGEIQANFQTGSVLQTK